MIIIILKKHIISYTPICIFLFSYLYAVSKIIVTGAGDGGQGGHMPPCPFARVGRVGIYI